MEIHWKQTEQIGQLLLCIYWVKTDDNVYFRISKSHNKCFVERFRIFFSISVSVSV